MGEVQSLTIWVVYTYRNRLHPELDWESGDGFMNIATVRKSDDRYNPVLAGFFIRN